MLNHFSFRFYWMIVLEWVCPTRPHLCDSYSIEDWVFPGIISLPLFCLLTCYLSMLSFPRIDVTCMISMWFIGMFWSAWFLIDTIIQSTYKSKYHLVLRAGALNQHWIDLGLTLIRSLDWKWPTLQYQHGHWMTAKNDKSLSVPASLAVTLASITSWQLVYLVVMLRSF